MSPEEHVQAYQKVLEKRADEIATLTAELQRYREREPLVQSLLREALSIYPAWDEAIDVRDFKVKS